MRNPARIKPFAENFARHWENYAPDWRFGQFMSNFLGFVVNETKQDIFFIEDDEMGKLLDKFFKNTGNNGDSTENP